MSALAFAHDHMCEISKWKLMLSAFHTILRSAVSLNLSSVSLLLIPTAGRRPTTPLTCLNTGGKKILELINLLF